MGNFRLRGRRRKNRERRAEGVPLRALFPNLITATAACAGITSISLASEGRFVSAIYALILACICDGVDGRVARLLHASSKLGAELDSLADFVNFGVAPAMFMYFWLTGGPSHSLSGEAMDPRMIRFVLGASLFYAMCDCFRLARFNTMLDQPILPYWKHFFTGVPAPGGCWMVLTPAILSMALDAPANYPRLQGFLRNPVFGIFMLLFVGALMASRLPTISLKAIHIHGRAQTRLFVTLSLLVIALLFADHMLAIGVAGILYMLTVPVTGIAFLRLRARAESAAHAVDQS